jgi:hypothetical protein
VAIEVVAIHTSCSFLSNSIKDSELVVNIALALSFVNDSALAVTTTLLAIVFTAVVTVVCVIFNAFQFKLDL